MRMFGIGVNGICMLNIGLYSVCLYTLYTIRAYHAVMIPPEACRQYGE